MTWQRATSATFTLVLGLAAFGAAGETQTGPMNGLYEVDVRLELPHLEAYPAKKRATTCLSDDGGNRGFVVLSDNNPLAACPASNVHQDGDTLTFDIICASRDGARASAKYRLGSDSFRGRIAMVMGGKNMTMTETQVGRRIGACPANP